MSDKRLKAKLKTVFLSSLGGGLELYDFIIFAIFAKTIGETFFPASSDIASLVKSYAVFAIGYLIRPVGGILFSHFGDKYGRKLTFAFSISLMGLSTLLMSLIPGFESWGLWATFTFVFLRLLQGISIGGEIPGAITFVSEHVSEQKGAACAVIIAFLNTGILLGDVVYAVLQKIMSSEIFYIYGWRVAFLLGGLLAFLSFYMRRTLEETDSFLKKEESFRLPIKEVLNKHKAMAFKATLIVGAAASPVSIYLLFMNSYLQVILDNQSFNVGMISLCQLVVFIICSSSFGVLSDYLNRRFLLFAGGLYLMFGSMVTIYCLAHGIGHPLVVLMLNAVGIAMYIGVMPSLMSDLFPVGIRYSGIALSYNCGFAIFGGLSPLLATTLANYHPSPMWPAVIVSGSSLLGLCALLGTISNPSDNKTVTT